MSAPPTGQGALASAPINLQPPGLLSLFQLKSVGRAPQRLSDQLVGVLELRDWYMQARAQSASAIIGATGNFQTASIATGSTGFHEFLNGAAAAPVPENQWWYVDSFSPFVGIPAADTVRFAPAIQHDAPNGIIHMVGVDVNDVITARGRNAAASIPRGFWAPPGSKFGVVVFDILTAAGLTFFSNIWATPLQV